MIANQDPLVQALLAGFFTWGITACGKFFKDWMLILWFASGAAMVYIIPSNSKKFLDTSLGL